MGNRLSVSQLNSYIKEIFDEEYILQNVSVYGEVYQFSVSGNNSYITLKEGDCLLQCVKFGSTQRFDIGTQVSVNGSLEFYRKAGKLSFVVRYIEKIGDGQLYLKFLQLKNQLEKDGYFANKCVMPSFVKNIGIVTSTTGAVIHDFLSVLSDSCPFVDVSVFQSKVQGDNADVEMSKVLLEMDKRGFDVIVIARGGGSATDLDCFNTELIVKSIASLKTPTISAVGHETDFSLCDLASTCRAGTPSIAAGIIADINSAIINRLTSALNSLKISVQKKYESSVSKLYYLSNKVVKRADCLYDDYKFRIYDSCAKIKDAVKSKVQKYENSVQLFLSNIDSKSPVKLLTKGYVKTLIDGKVVKSVNDINNDDTLDVSYIDGKVTARVTEVIKNEI